MDRDLIGIITFHASHNCGSMMQTYALKTFLTNNGYNCRIVNFSSEGQQKLYKLLPPWSSIKNVIKSFVFLPHYSRIKNDYDCYECFMANNFGTDSDYISDSSKLSDDGFKAVIAGSDQIWNITIPDYDDAYFLPWVSDAKKIAYSPSFGARRIEDNTDDIDKYKNYLNDFDFLSIREFNGQRWIKELTGRDAPVLLDPTLLLDSKDYDKAITKKLNLPEKYIFLYAPNFHQDFVALTKQISKKYNLPVITYNSKTYYVKGVKKHGFTLADFEGPEAYLQLIKNASLVLTTSFHGTVFSSIYRRDFWIIKNGGMLGSDDRVYSMASQLGLENRFIATEFDESKDYLEPVSYDFYEQNLEELRAQAKGYLLSSIEG